LASLMAAAQVAFAANVDADADAEMLRGEYVHGAQVSFFEPCGGGEALWVLEDGDSARALVRAHDELTTTAYEGVYVELRAQRIDNSDVYGVPAEYDALLSLDAIYEVRPLSEPGCGG
jgi:hypothetical protein